MNAIEIENLCKTYPRSWASKPVPALKNVSLQVPQGSVFGFIGANGAGKSTAIKILTGAMGATSGTTRLFDVSVDQAEARRGVGYVPENPSLPDYLTPLEILRMALSLHEVKMENAVAHCMQWLARFQIDHVAKKPIRTFSKGMAQRTALAHAMCVRPRLLILDEPLSGLDPVGRRDVVDILHHYKHEGGTVFLTSHVLHDVERLADRFGLIHQGEMKTVQSPNDLVGGEHQVTVRSVGTAVVEGMEHDSAGRWHGEVTGDRLWVLLDSLKQAGHQLVEVKPTLTLESAFFRYLGGAKTEENRSPADV